MSIKVLNDFQKTYKKRIMYENIFYDIGEYSKSAGL